MKGRLLTCTRPSAHTSGVKIKINQSLSEEDILSLLMDFDALKSVHRAGNSNFYILTPVVKLQLPGGEEVDGDEMDEDDLDDDSEDEDEDENENEEGEDDEDEEGDDEDDDGEETEEDEDEESDDDKDDDKSRGCLSDVSASFSDDNSSVEVTSTKDLGNVIVQFYDESIERFEDLNGEQEVISGTGENEGKCIVAVWIKSGCNSSGDGPGYGQFIENENLDVNCEEMEDDGGD